jgi:SAM-dependent methyltransferase
VIFTEKRVADATQDVEKIISLLDLEAGARVLDLGCGIGRHALALARRGYRVTGVDRTRGYLDRAVKQAEAERLTIEFLEEDMRVFSRPDAFDAVISCYTSYSYFEDPEEDRQVAANVCRSLRPGGAFLIELMGKELLARDFIEKDWVEEGGTLLLTESRLGKHWDWMDNRWIVIKDNERKEYCVSHRLYSAVELIALLTDCGFTQAAAYGNLAGDPYDRTADRLVVVARK